MKLIDLFTVIFSPIYKLLVSQFCASHKQNKDFTYVFNLKFCVFIY